MSLPSISLTTTLISTYLCQGGYIYRTANYVRIGSGWSDVDSLVPWVHPRSCGDGCHGLWYRYLGLQCRPTARHGRIHFLRSRDVATRTIKIPYSYTALLLPSVGFGLVACPTVIH